jgi:hypothetical protein
MKKTWKEANHMEKMIVISGRDDISGYQAAEINKYLEDGWTVKSVTMSSTHDYVTAIVVLER